MARSAERELRRRLAVNGSQVDGWLWRARHAIRQREPRRALEAMLSALWLLGAEPEPVRLGRKARRAQRAGMGLRAQLTDHDRRRSQ